MANVSFVCCICVVIIVIIYGIIDGILVGKPEMDHARWQKVLGKKYDIGSNEFNELFWLTKISDRQLYSRYNDYGVFLRTCPYCATGYKKIFYKRLTYKPSVDLLELIKGNWSNNVKYNVYGVDYLLYSNKLDMQNNKDAWESCELNNNISQQIGFPGLCYKSKDKLQYDQHILWDNNSGEMTERKRIKIWALRRQKLPKRFGDDLYRNNKINDFLNTASPTLEPTRITIEPTQNPSITPSSTPTIEPTINTKRPTLYPSIEPTITTVKPTNLPTMEPIYNTDIIVDNKNKIALSIGISIGVGVIILYIIVVIYVCYLKKKRMDTEGDIVINASEREDNILFDDDIADFHNQISGIMDDNHDTIYQDTQIKTYIGEEI